MKNLFEIAIDMETSSIIPRTQNFFTSYYEPSTVLKDVVTLTEINEESTTCSMFNASFDMKAPIRPAFKLGFPYFRR